MKIYCSECKGYEAHQGKMEKGGFVFTCPKGHFIKFPATEDEAKLKAMVETHNKVNEASAKKPSVDGMEPTKLHMDLLGKVNGN